jgi:hypothetical protein
LSVSGLRSPASAGLRLGVWKRGRWRMTERDPGLKSTGMTNGGRNDRAGSRPKIRRDDNWGDGMINEGTG